eukprot:9480748-Prorocentrum_lima.AAC.1
MYGGLCEDFPHSLTDDGSRDQQGMEGQEQNGSSKTLGRSTSTHNVDTGLLREGRGLDYNRN